MRDLTLREFDRDNQGQKLVKLLENMTSNFASLLFLCVSYTSLLASSCKYKRKTNFENILNSRKVY